MSGPERTQADPPVASTPAASTLAASTPAATTSAAAATATLPESLPHPLPTGRLAAWSACWLAFLPVTWLERPRALFPGVVLATTIAAAALFIGEHHGGPVMLLALLIGLSLGFLNEDARCQPGLDFAAKGLLKLGVALLGARVSFEQASSLGLDAVAMTLALLVSTILVGVLGARLTGRDSAVGALIGGSVAICGASAALAITAAMPAGRLAAKETVFTIASVTALSSAAMVVYPVLFAALGFSDLESGALIGATIHDVAQVVAAGYAVSEPAGDAAVIVKLTRVAALPLVLPVLALAFASGGAKTLRAPWFLVAFVLLLAASGAGLVPDDARAALSEGSRWMLVIAIAALGVRTSLREIYQQDIAKFALAGLTTIWLLVAALALSALFWG